VGALDHDAEAETSCPVSSSLYNGLRVNGLRVTVTALQCKPISGKKQLSYFPKTESARSGLSGLQIARDRIGVRPRSAYRSGTFSFRKVRELHFAGNELALRRFLKTVLQEN